jgi:hypothetical protein
MFKTFTTKSYFILSLAFWVEPYMAIEKIECVYSTKLTYLYSL